MIQMGTMLTVADNSGARKLLCDPPARRVVRSALRRDSATSSCAP